MNLKVSNKTGSSTKVSVYSLGWLKQLQKEYCYNYILTYLQNRNEGLFNTTISKFILSNNIYCCRCLVTLPVSDFVRPYGLQRARLLRPWDSLGKSTRECLPPGDIPDPGIESRSPTLQQAVFTTEPQRKP